MAFLGPQSTEGVGKQKRDSLKFDSEEIGLRNSPRIEPRSRFMRPFTAASNASCVFTHPRPRADGYPRQLAGYQFMRRLSLIGFKRFAISVSTYNKDVVLDVGIALVAHHFSDALNGI
jgi:hypothetical protein